MANYLFGDLNDESTVHQDCYVFVSNITARTDTITLLRMVINGYSDIDKTTTVYTLSSLGLSKISGAENDNDREIRALKHFKEILAPSMALVTDISTAATSSTTA